MSENVGVLSCNDLDDRHIFMWDYDMEFNDRAYETLQHLADLKGLDVLVLKTEHGVHFVDLHLFEFDDLLDVQSAFPCQFPSDYPTIQTIKREDAATGTQFEGSTLRINNPAPTLMNRVITKKAKQRGEYSQGHLDLYRMVLKREIFVEGRSRPTKINLVGYEKKIEVQNAS